MNLIKYKSAINQMTGEGPQSNADYQLLVNFFNATFDLQQAGDMSDSELSEMRSWFNGSFSTQDTLQGYCALAPRGYHGDYQIIDALYRNQLSDQATYRKWDIFLQEGLAPRAVRNRKAFFIDLLNSLEADSEVLNLASGPCRDLLEYTEQSDKPLRITNIDLDEGAIEFAENLLANQKVIQTRFLNRNIFRFVPDGQYDLVWSGGLFDYFDDSTFVRLLDRFSKAVKPGGKLVIGNFSHKNTSRPYMEFAGWKLHHRSPEKLRHLSRSIGRRGDVRLEQEPLGVNLFLVVAF